MHVSYEPTENDRKHAELRMDQARLLAAAHLPELLTVLVEKAMDPGATPKVVLDTADFAYRVSGMAKKQEDKPAGPSFSITINLPGQGKEITIGGKAERVRDQDPVESALACLPEFDVNEFRPDTVDFDFDYTDPIE